MTSTTAARAIREFRLPDLGEGLTEGEILRWLVAPGDEVEVNQPVVEVETAKAAVELPSPFAGTVTELTVAAGSAVDVGSVIIRFAVESAGPDGPAGPDGVAGAHGSDEARHAAELRSVEGVPAVSGHRDPRDAVLVGYGVRTDGLRRRRPRLTPAVGARAPERPVHVLAKPLVRKLARDRGIDLHSVTGSGPGGIVTRQDVESAGRSGPTAGGGPPPVDVASERPLGEVRIPIRGVRKATAAAMVGSAFTAPHVTIFHTVDATESVRLVARWRESPDFADVRVTPLLLGAKALLAACRRHPEINARWDEAAQEIVVPAQVNLGIAAATPRGLVVPNIAAADRLTTVELARALDQLALTARAGKTTPAAMTGGTITITNVGSFGVDSGTPILNPGEAAILCLGAIREQPWVHEGVVAVRSVTQLSMSIDHRLIDGALGAQVLADIAAALQDPLRLLAWS